MEAGEHEAGAVDGDRGRAGAIQPAAGPGTALAAPPPSPPVEVTGDTRRRLSLIGTVVSVALFLASMVVLWRIIGEISLAELRNAFSAASVRQIGLAILFTCISYLLLTGYDALALRQLGRSIAYRVTALASFTSYAVSFTLGFPLVTSGAVRYRIYSPYGIKAPTIVGLTVIAGITFWLGMSAVLAWSLMRESLAVAALTGTVVRLNEGLGIAIVAALGGYLAWVGIKRRSVSVQGWRLELPGFRLSIGQMLLGAGDVCAAAGVLFVLLPGGHGLSYETFLAIYVAACMLGIASHAPGGIGVFEATMLIALSHLPREGVLGALLLFRLYYYLVPFAFALLLLGAHEIGARLGDPGRR
ncbi:UPF0104 family protein [Chelatococcus daeguensis]|uniref:Uncharacterized protein n=2 Tax=Chelatococcus TaxID=28209 RepID=A0AAC9NY35_9HYPH|nr:MULTISPECIES: lysylphosphatidylglycerol synthase domain-containing protein [Chelatococcus]APF36156.1 hypothetical protein BOQ54_01430 [Chelatococcus daeguensis]KZE35043.1 hypothetical protein AVW15_15220 [Chelatococcus daeguensis]MBM3083012.1 UPF0104 family protein [Chelatococcus daeguensis]CUA88867.1 Uncharacterized membrane protein YbhN, UPF0104 family [Chelatococcus sambhunathii]